MTVEGFKFFQDAEGFSAFDINAFLMSQSVTRFDNSTDRDTALSSVLTAGMISYDKATGKLQIYDGSSWIDVATGTLTADHGALTGLADDDHPQYLTEARGDLLYAAVDVSPTITLNGDASGSVTLTNLGNGTLTVTVANDSHTHDTRYFTETEADGRYVNVSGDTMTGTLTYTLLNGPTGQTRDKIRVWNSSSYTIGMQSGYTYGHLNDYAMTFQMNSDNDRGWWWGDTSHSNAQGAMSLTTNGRLTVATSLNVGLGESTTSGSTIPFLAQSTSSTQVADIYRTGSAPGNTTALLVHNQYGNHSWGVVGEFRIEGSSGDDKPAILFSSAKVSTTWTVGYDYTGHEFGIRQNRGYRNGSWGTNRVLIDTVGRLTINTDSGNLQLGPHNTGYCHFFTDRGRYYFDTGLTIDTGIVSSYNENLSLRRADSEKMRIDDSITYSWHRFRAEIGGGTSVYWYNQGIQSEAPSGYKGGLAMSNLNSNTHTGQFRYASNTCYLRSYNDGAYRTLAAIISNQSSGRDKQDIVPLFASSTAGSMTNELLASGIEVVKQLRPVEYRWKKEKALDADLEGRREKALHRLDEYRAKKGLEPFASEETEHDCGRDRCEGTAEEPCLAYRNWERGEYGFIAQEVGDVIPQVTRISEIGENESIDALGLVAICVKALQELSAKVESLEAQLEGA